MDAIVIVSDNYFGKTLIIRSSLRPIATGGHGVPKFCCAQRNVFQTYNKNKNIDL